MERLGIGYEQIRTRNPRIIYCSISGMGQTGPYAHKPSYDTVGQGLSGLLGLLTDPNDPRPAGPAISDAMTGSVAAYGVLAALYARVQTGEGQRVETTTARGHARLPARAAHALPGQRRGLRAVHAAEALPGLRLPVRRRPGARRPPLLAGEVLARLCRRDRARRPHGGPALPALPGPRRRTAKTSPPRSRHCFRRAPARSGCACSKRPTYPARRSTRSTRSSRIRRSST